MQGCAHNTHTHLNPPPTYLPALLTPTSSPPFLLLALHFLFFLLCLTLSIFLLLIFPHDLSFPFPYSSSFHFLTPPTPPP